jgi:spermidine/putrescine-binding protein
MNDAKSFMLKILDTIGYADDRENFSDEFIKNTNLQSLSNLIQTLPSDKQDEVKQKLTENSNNPEVVTSILTKYFSQPEIQQSLQKAAQDMMSDYLQSINNSLSIEQKDNLTKVFAELHQNVPRPI